MSTVFDDITADTIARIGRGDTFEAAFRKAWGRHRIVHWGTALKEVKKRMSAEARSRMRKLRAIAKELSKLEYLQYLRDAAQHEKEISQGLTD